MPRCPKCSYKLVLLSNRPKYKCALCSKLYPEKEIELRDFLEWNKQQRTIEIEQFIQEELNKLKSKEENRAFIGFRKFFKLNKLRAKLSKEVILERKRQYYLNNIEKELLRDKIYRQNNLEKTNTKKKEWNTKNLELRQKYNLVTHQRLRQKQLTLQYLENESYKSYILKFFDSVSRKLLADLLGLK